MFDAKKNDRVVIHIKPLQGKSLEIEMKSKFDFVQTVKLKISDSIGFPVSEQKLLMGTKSLIDQKCLLDYGIDGSTTTTITLAKVTPKSVEGTIDSCHLDPDLKSDMKRKIGNSNQDLFWNQIQVLLIHSEFANNADAIFSEWKQSA